LVNETCLLGGQLPGRGRDVAGLIDRRLPCLGCRPYRREPVPKIQRVSDQPGRRSVRHAQGGAELGRRELRNGRGAFSAQPHRMLCTLDPARRDRLPGMQIGPMRGQVQAADLGRGEGAFVRLGGGQGAGRIQLHQIVFEHAFNIWPTADNPRQLDTPPSNGQHHAPFGQHFSARSAARATATYPQICSN
jgi:hypothetical protein